MLGPKSKKMQSRNNYRFFNLPKEYGISDYKKASSAVVGRYSKIKNLISIYNWGDPSVPGISDIDLMLVFNGSPSSLPISKRSYIFLDPNTKYLMYHPFIIIDEDSFRNARYVYRNTKFNLLYGKNVRIRNISQAENEYSDAALLNDIIIRHYPRDFLEQLVRKNIDVRGTLLRLNSLKYSLGIIDGLTNEKNKHENKLKQIDDLRKNWFKNNDFDMLASLNEDAVGIAMEITERFREYLIKNSMLKITSGDEVNYEGVKNRSYFVKSWNRENSLKSMSKNIIEKKKFYSILPIELAPQLFEYSEKHGPVSGYIRQKLKGNISYELKNKNIAEQRIAVFNSQAELALKLKHSDFAAFFDFGYRNKSGINNWILGMLDTVRH